MTNFFYEIPLSFNIEGPLYREGDLSASKPYNSYISMTMKPKIQDLETQLNQPIQQFTQDDIIKQSVSLEFEIIMNEFQPRNYDLIRIITFSGNLLSIALINIDHKYLQLKLSRSEQVIQFKGINFQCLEKQKCKLFITNELDDSSQTQFILNIGNQTIKVSEQTDNLRDFFRQLLSLNQITIHFGNKDANQAFNGRIQNLIFTSFDVSLLNTEPQRPKSVVKREIKQNQEIVHKLCIYTEPLDHLYQLASWNEDCSSVCQPVQKLRDIRRSKNKAQVIICHDMAGGYKEDSWLTGNHNLQHAYRFFHLMHIDIFIYFSHRLVTIPPQPYINICHQYGVKVLGNFITEGDKGIHINDQFLAGIVSNPNTGLNEDQSVFFYAEQLVRIAKCYGFDGWLINIESRVQQPELLLQFVEYLKVRIHEEIPGGLVVYYDSIIHSGELKWQSQLNQNNEKFFKASDLFFTDYKWDIQKLQQSALFAGNDKLKVFSGIDIWGRGTHGGGKWDTHKALKAIKQAGTSIALFAPGWTYESFGQVGKNRFLQTDEAFWNGYQKITLFDPKIHKWKIEKEGGNGWQIYYDESMKSEIAISSFDHCIRSFTVATQQFTNIPLGQVGGKIVFSVKVKGTGPKFDDPYLCSIELLNSQYQCVASIDSFNNKLQRQSVTLSQFNSATDNWVDLKVTIILDLIEPQIRNSVKYVLFREVGKDLEYWSGNYGSQFCCEDISFILCDPEKDLLKMLSPRRIHELPIQTYFNDGVGENCYIDGVRYSHQKGFYNILNDFDYIFPYQNKKFKSMNIGVARLLSLKERHGMVVLVSNLVEYLMLMRIVQLSSLRPALILLDSYTSHLIQNTSIRIYQISVSLQRQKINFKYLNLISSVLIMGGILFNSLFLRLKKPQEDSIYYYKTINKSEYNIRDLQEDLGYQMIHNWKVINLVSILLAIKQNVDFKNPAIFVKNIQLKESLNSINFYDKNSMLVDLYIEFEFPQIVLNMIKTIRIFKDKNLWLTNLRGTYCYISDIPYNWMNSPEFCIRLQLVLSNGNHMKIDTIKPILLTKDSIQMIE